MTKKRDKKLLSMLLALVMLLSILPLSGMAAVATACTEHAWGEAGLCTVCGAEKPADETAPTESPEAAAPPEPTEAPAPTAAPAVPSGEKELPEYDVEEENDGDSSAAPQNDKEEPSQGIAAASQGETVDGVESTDTAPEGVSPEEACLSEEKAPTEDQTMAGAAEESEPAEEDGSAERSAEDKQTDADQNIAGAAASAGSDASSSVKERDKTDEAFEASSDEAEDDEDDEDDPAVPFEDLKTTGAGVYVHASAAAGVLPAGTTMRVRSVSTSTAVAAASQAVDEDVCSARGVDISFYNAQDQEIEPNGNVQISIQLATPLEGEDFVLIHVPDSGAAENLGGATANGASFASDEFSLYVLAGVGTQEDPIASVYREYTIGFGESVTILSDEKDHDGAWIPGAGNPAWGVAAVSGGTVDELASFERVRGAADVQPRLTVTAKNKTGTLRVAFKYTHPVDETHKTVTGEFIATHYYLVHIVNKSHAPYSYSVVFRNNDGTGVSHVGEADLEYTTEAGVTVSREVSSDYKHTFTVSEDPTTRAGKVTLIMPKYPGETERISGGKTYEFIGWSILSSANSSTASSGLTPIVYPYTDAHIFAPGDKVPLDRDVTLWAIWSVQDNMKATFWIRIDDHIPNEPQSHGNASYIQIGKGVNYTLPIAQFATDSVYGVDQAWEMGPHKPWLARVFSDLKAAEKLPDDVTTREEFLARYRVVWSTVKRENDGWHVDGILYRKDLYNLAYHENGDLVVVSSMPEGVKDIEAEDTTAIDTRIPNRYDMVFTGWNTKADGSGAHYLPGGSVVVSEHDELDTTINTLHLYAQWVKSTQYTYHVRFLLAGTNEELKAPIFYGGQILGNKIYSKAESDKAPSEIKGYIFSYADPAIDSGDGCIRIGEDNSKNVITLYYMPGSQEIRATALFLTKTDEAGKPLEGAEFTLTSQEDSTKIAVFTSDENGKVQMPFTEDPGADAALSYTLIESKAPDDYVKSEDEFTIEIRRGEFQDVHFPDGSSKRVYPLVATVLKNGNRIDASDGITVVNKAKPTPVTYSIQATKVLEGRALQKGEFTFVLADAEGEQLDSTTNHADGTVSFALEAAQVGTYVYTLSEVNSGDPEIQYDKSVYTVTVTVELGSANKLAVSSLAYEKNGKAAAAAEFINKAILTITYDLNGGIYNGDTGDVTEKYPYGTEISIHEAPTRERYSFLYWNGPEYRPGDSYTVTEDHTFVAQWEGIVSPTPTPSPSPVPSKGPKTGDDSVPGLWLWLLAMCIAWFSWMFSWTAPRLIQSLAYQGKHEKTRRERRQG